ncbi:zinc finger and SCAN domain-containing protein 31-like [Entelurus aequoreus]|uniref:zinc finger and SCAN domain-containing protein 31-like n=1 Tax=Entelurus aequoreus TaxID=161455 RepID=UPI002B1D70B7|nr:zinc finger and SCAN domain-containing protein 31-like [Entelurus aequoreus]
MDDYCYAKMATSGKREHERESLTEKRTKYEDVQQLIGHPEELPPQSEGKSSTLKQETPQPPHIKKEEEELCITQEGECLLGREEADYTKFPLTVVSVKTEDDEEKPQLDNLLTPLPDREVEKLLSSDTDCEDVQQLIGHPEELPPQLGENSTLKQETPQPPCIKKEEGELCITQEGECLLEPKEADLTKLPLTVVSVKTEDDEEKPQPDNLLAPLSDSEAEDEAEEPLSSETDCEDVQQLIDLPEELPPQSQGGSSTLKQETPQPPHIKKEEEELWITQEGECLLGREEADYTKLPLTVVSVKTEDDEEKPQLDNFLAPLSDSEAEDEVEEPLSSDADCEGDMRTHTDNKHSEPSKKNLSCSVCAKSFTKKHNLTQHMRTHTGEKPFHCSVCGKQFSHKCNLTEHMGTHTREKTFTCSVCGKIFVSRQGLTQHIRRHTGLKPFNCSVCNKSFSQTSHLTLHMRTHTGEKPFKCSVCGRRFSQNSSLTQHMKTHAAE